MSAQIDVRRLVRIVAVLSCIVAAFVVFFTFAPDVDAASLRLDQASLQLNSDSSAFYQLGLLRAQRDQLSKRYARLFEQNPEAVFLRSLASDVARHGLTLVSTAESQDTHGVPQPQGSTATEKFGDKTTLTIEMRGSYRNLLAAIGELSIGSEIVRVDSPTLRREGDAIDAVVPVSIYEPTAHAPQQQATL
jgi:Tfp pilus assembly protein PilO